MIDICIRIIAERDVMFMKNYVSIFLMIFGMF